MSTSLPSRLGTSSETRIAPYSITRARRPLALVSSKIVTAWPSGVWPKGLASTFSLPAAAEVVAAWQKMAVIERTHERIGRQFIVRTSKVTDRARHAPCLYGRIAADAMLCCVDAGDGLHYHGSMQFGKLELDPAVNPAVLDTVTWDPRKSAGWWAPSRCSTGVGSIEPLPRIVPCRAMIVAWCIPAQ